MNAPVTRCTICDNPTLSGQSAHGQCGGYLPDNPRLHIQAAAHHIQKQLAVRPKTVDYLRHHMRPEYQGDVFDMALELLAGELARQGDRIKLAPSRRVPRFRDDGTVDGLFDLPGVST